MMARNRHTSIKRDPGEVSSGGSSVAVNSRTVAARAESAVPTEASGIRRARSNAPSATTGHRAPGETASSIGQNEEILFMETRHVKVQSDASDNAGSSFISNGRPFEVMGLKLKVINDALGKLQMLGIQHVASLPEIVLVGDQSAGKSSLMSALAGLNLPQAQGTCTRCPIHIRLSRADEWCCRVSLHLNYKYNPTATARMPTNNNRFPSWEKGNWEVQHFKTIRDPDDPIEPVLKWAQIAILNPSKRHETYSRWDTEPGDDEETEASFSPNTISLEITGPSLPDLSFYDLPGIFTNPGRSEDNYLVRVVQNLTREYIARESAIILWAVPMNADPETSSSFSLIRSIRGAEKRVLGVMTKADLLARGNDHRWIEMLEGKTHATGLGYFITSRPELEDLRAQEAWEDAFFNGRLDSNTWPTAFRQFEHLCGVTKLKDFLSQKLASKFNTSLPEVKAKVIDKQQEVEDRLSELPELPSNPEFEVRQSLTKFAELVRCFLKSQDFNREWKSRQDMFAKQILALKPIYRVKPAEVTTAFINLVDDESTPSASPEPQGQTRPKRRADDAPLTQTPSAKRHQAVKIEDPVAYPAFGSPSSRLAGASHSQFGTPSRRNTSRPPLPKRTLAEVRKLIHNYRNHGVPDDVPLGVKSQLCLEAITRWDVPLTSFLNDTMRILHGEVKRALESALANLRQRTVFKESMRHLENFLNDHGNIIHEQLKNLYDLEGTQIYSINPQVFEMNRVAERRRLIRVRHQHRLAKHFNREVDNSALPNFDQMSEQKLAEEELRIEKEATTAKLAPDDMRLEIELCAWVRAYYITAAMRFTENVSLHIISGLFPKIQKTVNGHIDEKLGLYNCADRALFDSLMEEEAKTAEERERLKRDLQKYESAMTTIHELEQSIGVTDNDVFDFATEDAVDGDGYTNSHLGGGNLTPRSIPSEGEMSRRTFGHDVPSATPLD